MDSVASDKASSILGDKVLQLIWKCADKYNNITNDDIDITDIEVDNANGLMTISFGIGSSKKVYAFKCIEKPKGKFKIITIENLRILIISEELHDMMTKIGVETNVNICNE